MSEHALTWGETPTGDDKLWGALAHLSVFVGGFIGPIVVLLIFQEKSKFIKYHATQSLMFCALLAVSAILISILSTITCGVGSLLFLPWLCLLLVPLWGAWKSWSGDWEGYPLVANMGK